MPTAKFPLFSSAVQFIPMLCSVPLDEATTFCAMMMSLPKLLLPPQVPTSSVVASAPCAIMEKVKNKANIMTNGRKCAIWDKGL